MTHFCRFQRSLLRKVGAHFPIYNDIELAMDISNLSGRQERVLTIGDVKQDTHMIPECRIISLTQLNYALFQAPKRIVYGRREGFGYEDFSRSRPFCVFECMANKSSRCCEGVQFGEHWLTEGKTNEVRASENGKSMARMRRV